MTFQFPQTPRIQKVNWKAVVFWGILLGLVFSIVVSLIYHIEPLYSSVTGFVSNFKLPDFSGALNGVVDYINKNPVPVILGSISAFVGIAGFMKSIHDSRAKTEAVVASNQQLGEMQNYYAQQMVQMKGEYETKLSNIPSNDGLLEAQNLLQTQKANFAATLDAKDQAIRDLQQQLQAKTQDLNVLMQKLTETPKVP